MEHLKELIDYVDDHLYQGYSEEHIRQVLLQHHWDPELIEEAFWRVKNPGFARTYYQTELPSPTDYIEPYVKEQVDPVVKTKFGFFMLKGRIGRRGYFLGMIYTLLPFVLCLIVALFGRFILEDFGAVATLNTLLVVVIGAGAVIAMLLTIPSLLVRRLHDLNQSGWWAVLLFFVPLSPLVLGLLPSAKGENSYGSKPYPYDYLGVVGLRSLE